MRVERRDFFFERTLTGRAVECAQGGEGGDALAVIGRTLAPARYEVTGRAVHRSAMIQVLMLFFPEAPACQ